MEQLEEAVEQLEEAVDQLEEVCRHRHLLELKDSFGLVRKDLGHGQQTKITHYVCRRQERD